MRDKLIALATGMNGQLSLVTNAIIIVNPILFVAKRWWGDCLSRFWENKLPGCRGNSGYERWANCISNQMNRSAFFDY